MKKRWLLVLISTFLVCGVSIWLSSINNVDTVAKPWHLPLSGKTIVLDPGHGGVDGGAVGADNIIEKDIALNIALKTRDYLQEQGAIVVMTRDTDKDLAPKDLRGYSRRKSVDLRNRAEIVNTSNADLFLSIHLNAIPVKSVKGAQVFFYPSKKENKRLAKKIQQELAVHFSTAKKLEKSINTVYLLKQSKPVAALVEVGFLSNNEEKYLLNDNKYQDKLASAIYRGVLRYFTDKEVKNEE